MKESFSGNSSDTIYISVDLPPELQQKTQRGHLINLK